MKKNKVIKFILGLVFLAFSVGYLLTEQGIILTDITAFLAEDNIYVKAVKIIDTLAVGAFVIIVSDLIVIFGDRDINQTVKTVTLLLGNVLKYVAIIGAFLAILSICGVDTSALVTASGVLALIVGLGCQSLVSDIVAGIFMIFEGDIKVGDIVVINGWRGTVSQIGLRRTKIVDASGNVNVINNSSISNIINNTKELSIAACEVGIEYNESIERVEAILSDNLPSFKEAIPAIIEGPFYKGVQSLAESSVNLKFVAKCREEDKYQVERDINRNIKILFDKYNINIPFNQIVLNYRDENESQAMATKNESKKSKEFVAEQNKKAGNIEEQEK